MPDSRAVLPGNGGGGGGGSDVMNGVVRHRATN